ncbi:MAG: DUF4232 domain-containing protein [Solirubrobacteraceae bacterium]
MRTRTPIAPSLAALALGLSACGGSGPQTIRAQVPTVPPGPASSTAAPRPSTAPSRTAPGPRAPTATSTTATGAPQFRCTASDLALSYLGGQGATGHGELGFALRNTSRARCRTFGYPGVQFLSQSGAPLPTSSTRTTRDFFGLAPVTQLVLAPGGSASFRLGVTHGAASPAGCTTAYGLQVIPPDDTATLRVAIAQGAYECAAATVSPLRPGTSAYP